MITVRVGFEPSTLPRLQACADFSSSLSDGVCVLDVSGSWYVGGELGFAAGKLPGAVVSLSRKYLINSK